MMLIPKITQRPILWASFIATLLLTIGFQVVINSGLILLDQISDPEQVRQAIIEMTPRQNLIHAWVTGTLDVAYPIAYGLLFIGSAHRFFPKYGWQLSAPTLALLPIDLAEGVVQILALTNTADWVAAKAFLTPVKFILFTIGLLITFAGWVAWLSYQRNTTTNG